MTRKSNAQKLNFLYALSARINEVAVVADRKGCGEVGLPPDYKDSADEDRLVNEGLQDLMEEYPE